MAVDYIDKAQQVAVLTRSGAVVTAHGFSPYEGEDYHVKNPSPWHIGLTTQKLSDKGIKIAPWGANNLRPLWLLHLLEHNNINSQLIWTKIRLAMGHVYAFKYEVDPQTGYEVPAPIDIDKGLRRYLNSKAVRDLLVARATDYFITGNTWCKIILTRDSSRVADIKHVDAATCRVSEQNPKTGRSDYQYICPDWLKPYYKRQGIIVDNANVQRYPTYDPADPRRRRQTMLHSKAYWTGHPYYGVQPWHSGHQWLNYSNSMPVWMSANINKAHNLKYHVEYPSNYFDYLETEFDNEQDRKEEKDRVLLAIDKQLAGADKAQSSIWTSYPIDEMDGKPLPGWKITPLRNDVKDEAYVKAYYASNVAAVSSQGIDPSLANIMLEGHKGPSGSDKRISYQIHETMKAPEVRDIMLEPLYIWKELNGLPEDLEFGFQLRNIVTLAEDPSGMTTPPTIRTQEEQQ